MVVLPMAAAIWLMTLVPISNAAFRFSNLYGNSMVLQMEPAQAHIWGYADSVGDTVTVLLDGVEVSSGTVESGSGGNSAGKWSIHLPASPEGGPHTVEITSSAGSITLTDVWFGDVWFCGGQSNMDFAVYKIYDTDQTIAKASQMTNIRFFQVARNVAAYEFEEPGIDSAWQTAGNDDATSNFSGLCLLFAMELSPHINDRPIGLVQSTWGDTPVEAWSSPEALAMCPTDNFSYGSNDYHRKSYGWNGMIVPVTPMTLFGALFYQGESNDKHPVGYKCSFAAMVTDWRDKFHAASGQQTSQNFPFGFVQLAAYRNELRQTGFPEVRWGQTYEYGYVPNPGLPDTFMAVSMDLPDYQSPYGSVHPRDKQDVAIRLVLGARAVAFGEDLTFNGPFPTGFVLSGSSMVLEYDNGNSVLTVNNDHGFEVCCTSSPGQSCDSNSWNFVSITDHDETSVTIDTSVCTGTVGGVRYAWEESPCDTKQCAIYGRDSDLPAPTFVKEAPFS